jgi:beta-lactamase superfamily II metal-dependent hydrolase
MHLTTFQSGKGDCLLLSNAANESRILIDGGMPAAFRQHVAPALGKLRQANKKIDLVYVSHIDQDHIGGVLAMLDHEVEWRVHLHQKKNGNPAHKPPRVPRPPKVDAIWHNAFHEQISKNAGDVENALAAAAPVLAGADLASLREAAHEQSGLATSIREAIQVSRRIGPRQLGIPLNAPAKGKLMMLRHGQTLPPIGGMSVTVLGPTESHMRKLRTKWNEWLRENQKVLKAIRDSARADEQNMTSGDVNRLFLAMRLQAEMFGNPNSVTPPNLASLTLLVEESGPGASGHRSILLTGDARGDQILDGLTATGRLAGGTFEVDVLKVPHHGSENNIDSDFCDTVIARDYIFCGNGEHENPDLQVIEMMARRRLAAAPGPFKFWFNSSAAVTEKAEAGVHMEEVEQLVKKLAKKSGGRMSFKLLKSGSAMVVS